jgi:hypothetical protein
MHLPVIEAAHYLTFWTAVGAIGAAVCIAFGYVLGRAVGH